VKPNRGKGVQSERSTRMKKSVRGLGLGFRDKKKSRGQQVGGGAKKAKGIEVKWQGLAVWGESNEMGKPQHDQPVGDIWRSDRWGPFERQKGFSKKERGKGGNQKRKVVTRNIKKASGAQNLKLVQN